LNEARLARWHHLIIFGVVVAAIVSRRPDALLNPQFYAEDGSVWYANAWNLGWAHALTLPEGGYLNTLPRLVCALAILIPLKSAPLLLNWAGILIQALPVSVLLSHRCANWGPLWMRALQALLYVALPNSSELNVTITNAHWHLALVSCLLAFANPPNHVAWKLFDIAVLLLTGLTGPWALVLLPLLLTFWFIRRQRWSLVMASLLTLCAAVQSWELLHHAADRLQSIPLGATFELFFRLIAGQIYTAALWGQNSLDLRGNLPLMVILFAVGTALLLWGLLALRLELKLFIAFSIVILAAALRSPLITGQGTQWQMLAIDKGARYWFFPMLAFLWTLLWAASQHQYRSLQLFSLICLAVLLRGIIHDWQYLPYKDSNFGYYAQKFEAAPPGTLIKIPLYPPGRRMLLVKHELRER
jgi:hypothetical protein